MCYSIFGLTLLAQCVVAQDANPSVCKDKGRACVALVLGGGGARGSAHIGVLKAIEELGLPIDLIVGTSIGSFVGGLYATGQSSAEIQQSFSTADWNSGYRDAISRSDIPVRRKAQLDYMPIHLDLGFDRDGLHLPLGMIQGQSMKRLVDQMLGSYSNFESFDDLPIPFRAVAADAVTGEQVVLNQGDLATAMQISMSLPGIVRPIDYQGRLLVDGGVAANLPISVAKSLGADIVIAVDIGSPALQEQQLTSGFTILRQLTSFLTRSNVEYQKSLLAANDVLLVPDISGVSLLSFDKTLEAVAAGYQIAMQQLPGHPVLSALPSSKRPRQSAGEARSESEGIVLDRIRLTNHTRLSDAYLLQRLNLELGQRYSQSDIHAAMNALYGQGTIVRIQTSWVLIDEENVLNIDVEEKEWGPGYLNFRLALQDDFKSFSRYQLGFSYSRTNISPLGGEWYSEFEVGTKKRAYTEVYWPIGSPNWFSLGAIEYERDVADYKNEGESLGNVRQKGGELNLGGGWSDLEHMELLVSGFYRREDVTIPAALRYELGELGLWTQAYNLDSTGGRIRLRYDSLDHEAFPRRGFKLDVDLARSQDDLEMDVTFLAPDAPDQPIAQEIGLQEWRTEIQAEMRAAGSMGRHSVYGTLLYKGLVSDKGSSTLGGFSLGGFLTLSGTPEYYVTGSELRFASAVYTYELAGNHFGAIDLPLYLGMSIEAGNVWRRESAVDYSDLLHSASLFVGWNSPLGPTYFAYGVSDAGRDSFYFSLGQKL